MDALKYIRMLNDKHFTDLKIMGHKYSKTDVAEMLELLKLSAFKELPLLDFNENACLVYSDQLIPNANDASKTLLSYKGDDSYGVHSLEDEIISTLLIEQIDTSRDCVRKILSGAAPQNEAEHRIWGMKQGFEFISNRNNHICAETMRALYEITINPYLEDSEDALEADQLYRSGPVSVVNHTMNTVIHHGVDAAKLPALMGKMFDFIEASSPIDDLTKASILHFYICYLHPYYDGNGRMARMVHLWYLLQKGYSSALFMPFSKLILESKNKYYKALDLVENNSEISGVLDLTPFLIYFSDNVYRHIGEHKLESVAINQFTQLLSQGKVTAKEKDLFNYVLSHYGRDEFSTKQLERDFGNCAYATIRTFVLKFHEHGILDAQAYGNRMKYRIAAPSNAKRTT